MDTPVVNAPQGPISVGPLGLPNDVWLLHVLPRLDSFSLASCGRVAKNLETLCADESLWRRHALAIPGARLREAEPPAVGWRASYWALRNPAAAPWCFAGTLRPHQITAN